MRGQGSTGGSLWRSVSGGRKRPRAVVSRIRGVGLRFMGVLRLVIGMGKWI